MVELLAMLARLVLEWQAFAVPVRALMMYISTPRTIEGASRLTYNLTMLLVELYVPSSPQAIMWAAVSHVAGLALTAFLEWLIRR